MPHKLNSLWTTSSWVSDSVATGKCLSLVSTDAERTMMTDLGAVVQLGSVEHYKDATEAPDTVPHGIFNVWLHSCTCLS